MNEASWYIVKGDARWDGVTPWMIEGDPTLYRGGVWIKKRGNITGYNINKNTLGWNGVLNNNGSVYGSITTASAEGGFPHYTTAGKPADTSGYFFLPALGFYNSVSNQWEAIGMHGDYWTMSPAGTSSSPYTFSTTTAFNVYFNANGMGMHPVGRETGYIIGERGPWFR